MTLDEAKRALSIGARGPMGEHDKLWLRDKMEEMAGTRDLGEANRRMRVVWEWRIENSR